MRTLTERVRVRGKRAEGQHPTRLIAAARVQGSGDSAAGLELIAGWLREIRNVCHHPIVLVRHHIVRLVAPIRRLI